MVFPRSAPDYSSKWRRVGRSPESAVQAPEPLNSGGFHAHQVRHRFGITNPHLEIFSLSTITISVLLHNGYVHGNPDPEVIRECAVVP